jgi:hypothetical protein
MKSVHPGYLPRERLDAGSPVSLFGGRRSAGQRGPYAGTDSMTPTYFLVVVTSTVEVLTYDGPSHLALDASQIDLSLMYAAEHAPDRAAL